MQNINNTFKILFQFLCLFGFREDRFFAKELKVIKLYYKHSKRELFNN